ncbi:MAG: NAD-dependent epimerase/dehydratase family protein [Bacilli bacterium]|jgi:nucleoside-diphosphate-sugar epimerase|nr:NAD-dependent epimerase/dehydratase family protein [Bacilli bacterium]
MKRILVTGSLGQIGSELVIELRKKYGIDNVIATGRRKPINNPVVDDGIYELLDVNDYDEFLRLAQKYQVNVIIHLAAVLSAKAEENPLASWHINMDTLLNALEVSRITNSMLFTCSSIGAFGPNSPKDHTPQDTIMRPTTMYGITKVAQELLCDYYFLKYNVDTRSVRFPGLISNVTKPGGGTTDYAVHIYYDALEKGKYTSFIDKNTYLDMMYMPDAIKCIIDLIEADANKLIHRNAYNVSAMSIEPEMIATSIKKHLPNFVLDYEVDPIRQNIANSWPNSLDTSIAKKEWNFSYQYDLDKMTSDMLKVLQNKKGCK